MKEPVPRVQIGVGGLVIDDRAKQLVMEVLESNRLTSGPKMQQFEEEMAALHDCRFAVMCNSGTSALHVALAALKEVHGWNDGDEILVPAVTFVATSNVVLYNNLKPVFVDVDPFSYNLDPARIEERITPRTRAIMPVHLAGLPCDMDPIMDVVNRHGLRVVEDSAETMFARYKGRAVGSFGDIGCFSTYVAHVVTTGVGGLCLTNDAELIVLLRSLINHGRDSIYIRIDDDQREDVAPFVVADRRFSFVRFGHSFRCTEMEAALGVAQLEKREAILLRRRAVADRLTAGLSPFADRLQLPTIPQGSDHVFMFYPLVVRNDNDSRDDLITHLEEHGVETRYLLPLLNQPAYRGMFGDLEPGYPVAARLNNKAFYVGCHPYLSDDDVDYMIETFRSFYRGGRA